MSQTETIRAADSKRKWLSIGVTVIVAGLMTLWGIYGIGEYGLALFVFVPFFIGACSTMLYGYKKHISLEEALGTGFLALGIFTAALVLCAIEGFVCIVMAVPFGILFTFLGSLTGYAIVKKLPGNTPAAMLVIMVSIPLTAFVEKDNKPSLIAVTTSIEIKASPETVWKNVIEFPRLSEPAEFIFKTGIAYPTDAVIEGKGVGAVRHCNFTTGSFVEPITVWGEPQLLKFDVKEQPVPLKELSFWDIDAPHLHDFFVSKQGQFKLTRLPNGNTLLEGTTWYYHHISPEFYWRFWSDYIIHKIHQRVLEHIKKNSEK